MGATTEAYGGPGPIRATTDERATHRGPAKRIGEAASHHPKPAGEKRASGEGQTCRPLAASLGLL